MIVVLHFMQAVGGAVLLYKGGMFDILRLTTFQANFATNSTDGTGFVNLGGEVKCDTLGCLPVCTTCASPPPTPQPTRSAAPPTPQPTWSAARPTPQPNWSAAPTSHPVQVMPQPDDATGLASEWVLVFVVVMSVGFMSVRGCVTMHRRTMAEQTAASTAEAVGILEMHSEPLLVDNENFEKTLSSRDSSGDCKAAAQTSRSALSIDDGWGAASSASDADNQSDDQSASNPGLKGDSALVASSTSLRENGKTLEPQISVSMLSSSPAPIFVVDHNMRITLWSQGERWALGLRRVPGLSIHPSMVLLLGV